MGQDEARVFFRACLGRGGFGEVYRATLTRSGGMQADVAVKVLRQDVDAGSDAVKRLRDEGRILGALRHPAILHVHDMAMIGGRVALITEYVEGEDLDRCIEEDPSISVRGLLSVCGEVAAALDAAWSTPGVGGRPVQLVHRDIKPSNIRIGRHGDVKLLDFGIAHATNVLREAQTANNALMGSYLYMAPERFRGGPADPASDVYALGCVLYEGIARKRFFEGETLKFIYNTMMQRGRFGARLQQQMRSLSGAGQEVLLLVRDLLEQDALIRPTASEAAERLEDLAEREPGPSLKRWLRSRQWSEPATVPGQLDGQELWVEPFGEPSVRVPAAVHLSQQLTQPSRPRVERPTVAVTPQPAPSIEAGTYQRIADPEMPDPIPGVLGNIRRAPGSGSRGRSWRRLAAAAAGGIFAIGVLVVIGTTYGVEMGDWIDDQRPALEAWVRNLGGESDLIEEGWQSAEEGELDAALELFDAALKVSPRDPRALEGRGTVLLRQGRRREAAEDLCAARRLGDAPLRAALETSMAEARLVCP